MEIDQVSGYKTTKVKNYRIHGRFLIKLKTYHQTLLATFTLLQLRELT